MNKTLPVLLGTALLTATSFSALAATQVDQTQAAGLQSMGVVQVTGLHGTIDDATRVLGKKAAAEGASYYRVIRADTPGDSSLWSGNAEIYR